MADPRCYTDSQVALCWIKHEEREWKQFVQNHVTAIRRLVPSEHWKHCSGISNPADIPSRGTSMTLVHHCGWMVHNGLQVVMQILSVGKYQFQRIV